MKKWRLRRRALLVGALVVLVVLVGIHYASDLSIGGLDIGGSIDESDFGSEVGLPSNHVIPQGRAVATNVLGATSLLNAGDDVYLDNRLLSGHIYGGYN